jgi:hypothetical protein
VALLAVERDRAVHRDQATRLVRNTDVTAVAGYGGMGPQQGEPRAAVMVELHRRLESCPAMTATAGAPVPTGGELAAMRIFVTCRAQFLRREQQRVRNGPYQGIIDLRGRSHHLFMALITRYDAVRLLKRESKVCMSGSFKNGRAETIIPVTGDTSALNKPLSTSQKSTSMRISVTLYTGRVSQTEDLSGFAS